MLARQQGADARIHQLLQEQPGTRLDLGQHGDVDVFAEQRREGFLGVAQAQVDGDSRIARAQPGEHRHHQARAVGGDFEAAGDQLSIGVEQGLGFFLQGEQGARDRHQARALLGQFDAPGGAPEQGDLVVLLERLDASGHRRLADAQALGGAGETAFAGDGVEGAELEEIHGIGLAYGWHRNKQFER